MSNRNSYPKKQTPDMINDIEKSTSFQRPITASSAITNEQTNVQNKPDQVWIFSSETVYRLGKYPFGEKFTIKAVIIIIIADAQIFGKNIAIDIFNAEFLQSRLRKSVPLIFLVKQETLATVFNLGYYKRYERINWSDSARYSEC